MLVADLLIKLAITGPLFGPEQAFKLVHEVVAEAIIVEQGVVDIEEYDELVFVGHGSLPEVSVEIVK
ncbi:hypothetical protein GCM10007874_46190 [Labrys miyagiensis]|uniref:Uncharacterized protein n=1 Tax=Labrys miyagiensis TaxID=346912 RepID=A0ABQ6CML1_9HYPH|nr:hypothetical protein GCM10007874_46190 [Labrys miyagiensis]